VDPSVHIFWTGPDIISETIDVSISLRNSLFKEGHIETIGRKLGRKPIIWDNLFANDYDMRRVFEYFPK
jgi:hypothetical protein